MCVCVCICVRNDITENSELVRKMSKTVKAPRAIREQAGDSHTISLLLYATIAFIFSFFLFFSLVFGKILCVIIYFLLFKAGNLNSLLVFSNSSFLDFTLPQDILGIQYTLGDSRLFQFERNLRWKEF